jgi:hypothetical protein
MVTGRVEPSVAATDNVVVKRDQATINADLTSDDTRSG